MRIRALCQLVEPAKCATATLRSGTEPPATGNSTSVLHRGRTAGAHETSWTLPGAGMHQPVISV